MRVLQNAAHSASRVPGKRFIPTEATGFFFEPQFGAPGRGVEGSWQNLNQDKTA
jgi:hypothetical protein